MTNRIQSIASGSFILSPRDNAAHLVAGDSLGFKIWDSSAEQEYDAVATWTGTATTWSVNALIQNLASLTVTSGSEDEKLRCDVNQDGEIDIFDVAVIAKYFGQSVN